MPCCLLVLVFSASAAPEEITIEDGKMTLFAAILNHTTWPQEDEFDHFVIGMYGRDKPLMEVLRRETPKLMVRGKPVVVTQFNSLSAARAAHVLVLAISRNFQLVKIERELHLSHTLIVTDGSNNQSHIMVNFTHPTETRLSFEINRSNIVYAGLKLSKSILLFGGTELDAATIYKETEAELVRAKAVQTEQQQQLEVQQDLLAEQAGTIETQRKQVALNKAELANLGTDYSGLEGRLVSARGELANAVALASFNREEADGLITENADLAARLTTAQIRRLEAERMLLEAKLELLQLTERTGAPTASTTTKPHLSSPVGGPANVPANAGASDPKLTDSGGL